MLNPSKEINEYLELELKLCKIEERIARIERKLGISFNMCAAGVLVNNKSIPKDSEGKPNLSQDNAEGSDTPPTYTVPIRIYRKDIHTWRDHLKVGDIVLNHVVEEVGEDKKGKFATMVWRHKHDWV